MKDMTDEEIVKALDICTTADDDMDCIDDCPMYEEDYCTTKLLKMAFDLIRRLRKGRKKKHLLCLWVNQLFEQARLTKSQKKSRRAKYD